MNENTEKEILRPTVVVYTDGSAGPTNPGFYGSGVHGFIYDKSCIDKKNTDTAPDGNFITTRGYTKIDVTNNPIVSLVKPLKYLEAVYSFGANINSNNAAELLAISKIVRHLIDDPSLKPEKIIIKTDSQYAKDTVWNRIIFRKKINFDYNEIPELKNKEHYDEALELVTRCEEAGIELKLYKTPGHSDSLGNNIADRLAVLGKEASIKEKTLNIVHYTDTKFWKAKQEAPAFLKVKELYFTHDHREALGDNQFCIMDYPTDVETGKKHNGALFGVVHLGEENAKGIKEIIAFDKRNSMGLSRLSSLDLTTYFSGVNVRSRNMLGMDAYTYKNSATKLLARDPLIILSSPQGLAKVALIKTMELADTLARYEKFIKGEEFEDNGEEKVFVDITEDIYTIPEQDPNSKKKKPYVTKLAQTEKYLRIKPKIKFKDLEKEFKVILPLGIEIVARNTLKKLEKKEPKVFIEFTRKTKDAITYAVVVDGGDEKGAYSNYLTASILI